MPLEYDALGNPINGNWSQPTVTERAMQAIAERDAAKKARAIADLSSATRVNFDQYEDPRSPFYGQEPPAGSEGAPGNNILNNYRSFNYNFTLSALTSSQFNDPSTYNSSIENLKYIVLSSKGKPSPENNNVVQASENTQVGLPTSPAIIQMQQAELKLRRDIANLPAGASTAGFEAALNENIINRSKLQGALQQKFSGNNTEPIDAQAVVADYNKISSGVYDMFIDDIQIDAIVSNNEQTTTSLAYEIKFSVIEPYSVFGFLEALQASAKAAGYDNYRIANFVLAVDFIGYPDNGDMPNPVPVMDTATNKPAIRFFALNFYDIKASVTDRGTVYTCSALPAADKAFSNTSDGTVGTPQSVSGDTVQEVLKNLIESLNTEAADRAAKAGSLPDFYAVEYPEFTESGQPLDGHNSIANATFDIPDGKMKDTTKSNQSGSESKKFVAQFEANASNKQKIEAVIVASTYVTDLAKAGSGNSNVDKKVDAANQAQMFRVVPRKEEHPDLGIDPMTQRPVTKWIYQIFKTKTSYHRVPGQSRNVPSLHRLKKLALRRYDYIYSGLNTDILDFKIDFNLAFYEAVSPGLGADNQPLSRNNTAPESGNAPTMKPGAAGTTTSPGGSPVAPMLSTPATSSNKPYNMTTAGSPDPGSPWTQQSRLMYQGIMGAPDAFVTGDITILGDPYFLISGGVGNYIPSSNIQGKYAGNGEASVLAGDVLIQLNFYNPIDIGLDGFLKMDAKPVGFSGVFQIIKVTSQFKNGEFKQVLQYVRIPTPDEPTPVSSKVGLDSKPINEDAKGQDSSPAQAHPALASDGVIVSPAASSNKPPQPPVDKTPVLQGFTADGNPVSKSTIASYQALAAGLKNPFAPLTAAVSDLQAQVNSVQGQITGAIRSAENQVTGAIASNVAAVTSPLNNIIRRG